MKQQNIDVFDCITKDQWKMISEEISKGNHIEIHPQQDGGLKIFVVKKKIIKGA